MDQLEKYIRENQDELDRIESVNADALWEKIHAPQAPIRQLERRPASGWHIRIGRNWRWTAAAVVVLSLGIAIWLNLQPATHPGRDLAGISAEDYYPEIGDEENAFRRTIARKEAELGLKQLDRQRYIDIFNELDELEQIHRQQLKDLPQVFDNEEWVRTLMRYYEQKLRILERLSREIDKREQLEERTDARI